MLVEVQTLFKRPKVMPLLCILLRTIILYSCHYNNPDVARDHLEGGTWKRLKSIVENEQLTLQNRHWRAWARLIFSQFGSYSQISEIGLGLESMGRSCHMWRVRKNCQKKINDETDSTWTVYSTVHFELDHSWKARPFEALSVWITKKRQAKTFSHLGDVSWIDFTSYTK